MSRFTMNEEFDGVTYYDVYTDTKTGEKYGIGHYGDSLDLLNTQAEQLEVLREWIRERWGSEIQHCRWWAEFTPLAEITDPKERKLAETCIKRLAALEGT